jgi:hypothetical protein
MADQGSRGPEDDGLVDVAGVAVPAGIAEPTPPRPRVVIVAEAWGANWGERAAAIRLIAGALALRASVSVVSIEDRSNVDSNEPALRYDGVFPVYSVAAPAGRGESVGHGPRHLGHSDLVRASLSRQAGGIMPEVAARGILASASLPSPEALDVMYDLGPDVVVLAGPATFWMRDALGVGTDRPRVVVLPLCGDDQVLSSAAARVALGPSDAIGAFSGAEFDRIAQLLGSDAASVSQLHRIRIALPVNRLAAAAGMAGLAPFGRYVLIISAFADDPATGRCPSHEYLRHVLGRVSIAEVRREGWVVTAATGRRFNITWAPTRMNLWRLMARAEVTVDVRSQGPIGREAIESLRFSTPVVVPGDSVAAEHAQQSNGGLWYRNFGEMIDCVTRLFDDEALRTGLGASGEEWADLHHGDMEGFVEAVIHLVLGTPAPVSRSPIPVAEPA